MFSFFKHKKKLSVDISNFLFQDMHSHILPGIDDGAPDVETAIELIKGMKNSGIKHFIGTPHIMADIHPNNIRTIKSAYDQLMLALSKENLDITVSFAAEYMIDDGFLNILEKDKLLTIYENYILFETPFYKEPLDIEDVLFQMETKGYKGIFAHPERYHFIDPKLNVLEKYINRGFHLQLNVLSLSGYYGLKERDVALQILDAGLYSFIGTDLHHDRHMNSISTLSLEKKVIDKLETTNWLNNKITEAQTSIA